MAAVVSHAMRRFPSTPPDEVYSSYKLRGESSRRAWSLGDEGESALSRSMRYADPWLYGSVRAHGGLFLTPAFVLCACADYVNGTKRSKKGSPTSCKKCKGTRLPFSPGDAGKFGTVRCYSSHTSTGTPVAPMRAGTVRVTSSSRPSILPTADPYDLMRRSRLSVSEGTSQFRARSISPNQSRNGDGRSHSATRNNKGKSVEPISSPTGRRSILECDINPYELISKDPKETKDTSITYVNGQRIRVRPQTTTEKKNEASENADYEDVQVQIRRTSSQPPSKPPNQNKNNIKSPSSPKPNEKESESNRFKSILKKPPATFSDTDSNGPEQSPSPSRKTGSHFYLPMPVSTPRKKVQFAVENELTGQVTNEYDKAEGKSDESEDEKQGKKEEDKAQVNGDNSIDEDETNRKVCKLRRSVSERFSQESTKVVFHDTMALRTRNPRSDSRGAFTAKDLQRLDGLTTRLRKTSPSKPRPKEPPPPPPPAQEEQKSYSSISKNEKIEELSVKEKSDIDDETRIIESESKQQDSVTVPKRHEIKKRISFEEKVEEILIPNREDEKYETEKENNNSLVSGSKIYENYEANNPLKDEMCNGNNYEEPVMSKKVVPEIKPSQDSVNKPPLAPPRKRSISKQPQINIVQSPSVHTVKIESPIQEYPNKTVVQINSAQPIHKLQIKNEFAENDNIQTFSITDSPQRKTSILIKGDDCYSTVNVNDDVPLYQSSVVVKDTFIDTTFSSSTISKKSSTVYITGNFETNIITNDNSFTICNDAGICNNIKDETNKTKLQPEATKQVNTEKDEGSKHEISKEDDENIYDLVTKDYAKSSEESSSNKFSRHPIDKFSEDNIPSSDLLLEMLKDPVEAVRRNLVPHVCGKSDMNRRQRDKKLFKHKLLKESLIESPLENSNDRSNFSEDSFLRLRNYETIGDDCSENSSSTQYELVDPGSECYTDHSNRSSVTEDELANRTKFYELLADSNAIEVSENDDHHYESIKVNNDPIYEEIEVPPPLPSNPPPMSLLDDLHLDKEFTTRSIFEGASKYDILSYLVDAKERGIVPEDSYTFNFNNTGVIVEEDTKEPYNRISHMSTVSDSSEDSSLILTGHLIDDKNTFQKTAEVERNDSGVGSETSKSSLSKYRIKQEPSIICEDCESILENQAENEPLVCRKCVKKRSERKEIITEIVETEEKYSRDLQIILEEFYQPMLVAGLLTAEQLSAIFLNVEELLENSQALAERLRDAVDIAIEQGDEDLQTVNIGKLFLEAAPMLHAFETYCVRQGAASLLLASLEKDKELLRIFLRVSQMENTLLRRMNLNSFLMVPVQRVTKYPLLLARLYKVTPLQHETRDQLKNAQHKIELHLNHMNSETKDIPSKLWRRIGSSSGRRASSEMDLVNIKLRKIAVDVLEWNHEEAKFALEGKLLFTQPTDNNWRKGRTIKLTPVNALLVINGKPSPANRSEKNDKNDESGLIFNRHSGVREAALLLVRDKNGRYSLLREPLYLDRCVIAADPAWQSYFEVQELLGKDTFIFKAEDDDQTGIWYRQLQHHAQGMGAWRKRRNALANIMINGMGLRS